MLYNDLPSQRGFYVDGTGRLMPLRPVTGFELRRMEDAHNAYVAGVRRIDPWRFPKY